MRQANKSKKATGAMGTSKKKAEPQLEDTVEDNELGQEMEEEEEPDIRASPKGLNLPASDSPGVDLSDPFDIEGDAPDMEQGGRAGEDSEEEDEPGGTPANMLDVEMGDLSPLKEKTRVAANSKHAAVLQQATARIRARNEAERLAAEEQVADEPMAAVEDIQMDLAAARKMSLRKHGNSVVTASTATATTPKPKTPKRRKKNVSMPKQVPAVPPQITTDQQAEVEVLLQSAIPASKTAQKTRRVLFSVSEGAGAAVPMRNHQQPVRRSGLLVASSSQAVTPIVQQNSAAGGAGTMFNDLVDPATGLIALTPVVLQELIGNSIERMLESREKISSCGEAGFARSSLYILDLTSGARAEFFGRTKFIQMPGYVDSAQSRREVDPFCQHILPLVTFIAPVHIQWILAGSWRKTFLMADPTKEKFSSANRSRDTKDDQQLVFQNGVATLETPTAVDFSSDLKLDTTEFLGAMENLVKAVRNHLVPKGDVVANRLGLHFEQLKNRPEFFDKSKFRRCIRYNTKLLTAFVAEPNFNLALGQEALW
ncbi:hypothetical protein C8R45DRAFT_944497 [Mycena sanguinolenta]|nr:hypothetical protein C8R45DRAFT_944497 [Mycena sanguinolenta]